MSEVQRMWAERLNVILAMVDSLDREVKSPYDEKVQDILVLIHEELVAHFTYQVSPRQKT